MAVTAAFSQLPLGLHDAGPGVLKGYGFMSRRPARYCARIAQEVHSATRAS